MRSTARAALDHLLHRPRVAQGACLLGGFRARGLALLWHRIRPEGSQGHEIVRAVPTDALAEQLEVLCAIGDVVPLADLETSCRGHRPRFALTFDDDDGGHVDHTLPLLVERDLPATFFLSGRWQHDDGPYWWELLEKRLQTESPTQIASEYGLPSGSSPEGIAGALTGTSITRALDAAAPQAGPAPMRRDQARELVAAGMEIGFHTRRHPSLPTLDERELRTALADGREELASELATAVVRFAYPHGHVDARVASGAAAAGYRSAWTTEKRVVVGREDPVRLGRWDLGHLDVDTFRTRILRALVRPRP
jgi:peptidoglycan/xylan/chitin deacetylase (PgdA/CDA1 family)